MRSALIPITGAHVDSCLYHGQATLDFVDRLVDGGATVRVPTTLNVGTIDLLHPELWRGDPELADRGRRLMDQYRALGCRPTFTCAPYQLADSRPGLGDQVAWGESNAIVFANSVLGARTNRYGDFLDIACAVVGRVPDAGLHRTENRAARVVVRLAPDVPPALIDDDAFYPVLGIVVGRLVGGTVVGDRRPAAGRLRGPPQGARGRGRILRLGGPAPRRRIHPGGGNAGGGAAGPRTRGRPHRLVRRSPGRPWRAVGGRGRTDQRGQPGDAPCVGVRAGAGRDPAERAPRRPWRGVPDLHRPGHAGRGGGRRDRGAPAGRRRGAPGRHLLVHQSHPARPARTGDDRLRQVGLLRGRQHRGHGAVRLHGRMRRVGGGRPGRARRPRDGATQ